MSRSSHTLVAWAVRLSVLSALLPLGSRTASAGFVAITTPATAVLGPGAFTLGYEFLTGPNAFPVSALGVWDEATGTPTLTAAHQVGIFDTSGSLLTSVIVPAAVTPSNQIGAYAYTYLPTPYFLAANTNYILVTESNNDDAFHGSNFGPPNATWPVFSTPNVNYVQRESGALGPGSTILFPTGSGGSNSAWDAPNLLSVPEPASVGLFAVGAIFLVSRSWRKNRQVATLSSRRAS